MWFSFGMNLAVGSNIPGVGPGLSVMLVDAQGGHLENSSLPH